MGMTEDHQNPVHIDSAQEAGAEPRAGDAPAAREQALRLHRQLAAAVLTERRAIRHIALGLAQMERTRGFRELGYAGLAEYGEQAFGFGTGKTRQLARLGRKLAKLPVLDRALATGALGWTKARTVAQVAAPETEEQWVAIALAQSSRELEDLAWRHHEGQPPTDPRDEVDPPRYVHARFLMQIDHFELLMRALTRIQHLMGDVDVSASQLLLELAERELERLEEEIERDSRKTSDVTSGLTAPVGEVLLPASAGLQQPSPVRAAVPDGQPEHVFHPESSRGENALRTNYRILAHRCPTCETTWAETRGGRFELTEESRERIECDCEIVVGDDSAGTPGHLTRSIPPATRRAVLIRDAGHCQVPGCRNHRYLDLHHVLPRSEGGDHAPTNLVTVCSTHHELVHRDIVTVHREPDGTLTWHRGRGEPLGVILALDNDRAEIGHDYLSEFDGSPGGWCLIETPADVPSAEHVFHAEPDPEPEHAFGEGPDLTTEHVFANPEPRGPTRFPRGRTRFPRGRTSFHLGDAHQMATRDLYRPLPTGLG